MSDQPSRREVTAAEIAALTGGRLVGPGDIAVAGIAPLERAGPGDVSFLASARYLPYLERARAGVVLCAEAFANAQGAPQASRIIVPDPHAALLAVLDVLYPEAAWSPGVHPTAVIGVGAQWADPVAIGPYVVLGRDVRLGRNVRIGAHCVIGDGVSIGDETELFPHVTCYPGTTIGRSVRIHSGVRLGGDGFGYVPGRGGAPHRKIPQVGRCRIGDEVEIGVNSCVDRGSVDDTVIGDGTKIDNLVHIAHNVHIGAHCLIMAQVGIAGSCVVEDGVILAGQAGLADHLTVHRGARVAAQSGVIGDIAPGATVSGYPARHHRDVLRQAAAVRRLTPLVQHLERIAHHDHTT